MSVPIDKHQKSARIQTSQIYLDFLILGQIFLAFFKKDIFKNAKNAIHCIFLLIQSTL